MGPRRRSASLGPQVVTSPGPFRERRGLGGEGPGGEALGRARPPGVCKLLSDPNPRESSSVKLKCHVSLRLGWGWSAGPGWLVLACGAAGLRQDEGRNTSFNFQGPNTSFKGRARVVNSTLNRSGNAAS